MDYPLCRHTVTVYRPVGQLWQRQVAEGCFCTWRDRQKRDITGDGVQREFSLVLPAALGELAPGDWVVEGTGPADAQAPSRIPGAEMVTWVRPVHDPGIFGAPGCLLHTEAGNG